MSAWSIGRRSGAGALGDGANDLKTFVDRVVQWIPADVIAIYGLGITALKAQDNDPNPSVLWLVLAGVLAFIVVMLGAVSRGRVQRRDWALAVLAVIAFAIWSLAVPDSGWYDIDWVVDNPGWVAIIAAVAGILFGAAADAMAPD
jgi:hypothetical protein